MRHLHAAHRSRQAISAMIELNYKTKGIPYTLLDVFFSNGQRLTSIMKHFQDL